MTFSEVQSRVTQVTTIVGTAQSVQGKIDSMLGTIAISSKVAGNQKQTAQLEGEIARFRSELEKIMVVVKQYTGRLTLESAHQFVVYIQQHFELMSEQFDAWQRVQAMFDIAKASNGFAEKPGPEGYTEAQAQAEVALAARDHELRLKIMSELFPVAPSSSSSLVLA